MATLAHPPMPVRRDAMFRGETKNLAPDVVAPRASELAGLALLLAIGAVGLPLGGALVDTLNIVLPILTMALVGRGTLLALRASGLALWTPMLWFRAATFFYSGFGALVLIFASDTEISYVEYFFQLFPQNVLRYNLCNIGFALAAFSAVKVTYAVRRRQLGDLFGGRVSSSLTLNNIGLAFLAVGLIANVVFVIPYQFGFIEGSYSAIFHEISQLLLISFYLLALGYGRDKSINRYLVYALAGLFSVLGFLAMSKSDVVMPIIMVGLALLQIRPTFRRLAIFFGLVSSLFVFSAGPVDQGRWRMQVEYGSLSAPASIDERLRMIGSYFNPDLRREDDQINQGMLRFSYVNVGSYVIDAYDNGRPGDSFRDAAAVLVPRALWPDKPILTDTARELSLEMTGNWNSSIAPGLPPEAYWNFGWMGVALIGLFVGLVVGLWSLYAISVQVSGAWHLFPVLLLGSRMGSRLDGFFVVDILGPVTFAIAGHLILTAVNAVVPREAGRG